METDPTPTEKLLSLLAEPSWCEALSGEFAKPYMVEIARELEEAELSAAKGAARIAPPLSEVFRALNLVPIEKVRVVVLGQDPYPNPGDADGLAFSVSRNGPLPNALAKVLAEARRDLKWTEPTSGDLAGWAASGVLLLNTALTNLVGSTWAHGKLQWQSFTRAVLRTVARNAPPSVILLWGAKAGEFADVFDGTKHKVLRSDHPCASRAVVAAEVPFRDSQPFSKANAFLRSVGRPEVDWRLSSRAEPSPAERARSRDPSRWRPPVRVPAR